MAWDPPGELPTSKYRPVLCSSLRGLKRGPTNGHPYSIHILFRRNNASLSLLCAKADLFVEDSKYLADISYKASGAIHSNIHIYRENT